MSTLPEGIDCLADILRVHAKAHPDKPALDFGARTVSFGELYARSCAVASALQKAGVERQSRVCLLARNGIESFEVTFGAALLGAVAVPLNWRLAPPEIGQILADAEAPLVVAGPELVSQLESALLEAGGRPASTPAVVVIGGHSRFEAYEDWAAAREAPDPGVVAGPGEICYQLYTSGTTGLPKGVMLTTSNVVGFMKRIGDRWGFEDRSVNLALMPMFHIAGLGWSMVGLAFGARTVVLADADPGAVRREIEERRVTHAFMVPAVIQMLLQSPAVAETDFSSLRTLVYGASPISAPVLTKAISVMRCGFVQVYGLTETTGAITELPAEDHDPISKPDLLRSCGKPYPWVEMRVVESATGRDLPDGEVGELWTRSPQNMAGYWHDDRATSETLTPEGWLKTGDAGYRDSEGYLYLHDRVKDMIVTGGENVYPAEVENVLMHHPGVADVAVVGVPDERWGEAVKAVVVPAGDPPPDPAELIAFCRERLAGFKCPKSVDFAQVLPRNPSGKLLKREIRAPYWEGRERYIG